MKLTKYCDISSRFVFIISLATLASGCGGGGFENSNAGTGNIVLPDPDNVAPTISAMTPGEDTTGLGTNGRFTATFSEAMAPSGITPANFRVNDGVVYIAGSVSYDNVNNIAIFTPDSNLLPHTRYTATVITGIKDTSGNPIVSDFAWCIVTGSSIDDINPVTLSTIPDTAATNIPINTQILVNFSEEMDSMTVRAPYFTLSGPGSVQISGNVKYVNRTAIFKPAQNLIANTIYTAMLTTNITDLAGNPLSVNKVWTFTTGFSADNTAPVVTLTNPASNETGVDISRDIQVAFNKPMDPETISTANIRVTGPADIPVTGTVLFDYSTNTAIFKRIEHLISPVAFHPIPVSNLDLNTTYTVRLNNRLKDIHGNQIVNDTVWTFTTAL